MACGPVLGEGRYTSQARSWETEYSWAGQWDTSSPKADRLRRGRYAPCAHQGGLPYFNISIIFTTGIY